MNGFGNRKMSDYERNMMCTISNGTTQILSGFQAMTSVETEFIQARNKLERGENSFEGGGK